MADELDLVNDMLMTLGDLPVSTLDIADADVAKCRKILNKVSRQIQTKGLWCNTESWELTLNAENNILLPNNTLALDGTTQYAMRDNKLYDITNKTFTIDPDEVESVTITLILELTYEELPISLSDYIGASANLQYFMQEDGDPTQVQMLNVLVRDTKSIVQDEDLAFKAPNMITGNPTVSTIFNALTKRR